MDKKLIGLIIVVIIAVITVSGCIGDDNSSMNISEDNHKVNESHENEENSSSVCNDPDCSVDHEPIT